MQTLPADTGSDTASPDLGPLAWVLDELRKSLDNAAKALRRFVREAQAARGSGLADIDSTPLRSARQQLHQAMGALDMVGQSAPALLLRAMESVAQKFIEDPALCTDSGTATVEQAGFALLEYLEAVLAGRPVSPVGLFPQYRAVQELAGADRVHPGDLFTPDWRWADAAPALPATLARPYEADARTTLDHCVLRIVRSGDPEAALQLRDVALGFAAHQSRLQARVFWQLVAAYAEAFALGLLPLDVYAKRAATRILLQYSTLARGDDAVSERLAQDLQFFCAQAAPGALVDAQVLNAVRTAHRLDACQPVAYTETQFGRFDPALLAQARKRIAAAKDAWSHLSGGDAQKLRPVADQFGLVADSLVRLHPPSATLAQTLTRVMDAIVRSGQPPGTELAMEVATSVLYLEATFQDFDPSDLQLAWRTNRLAERLDDVLAGAPARPLEAWMEELYRRVSDRQTMGSVVGELRTGMAELESALDQFFRQPREKGVLTRVPAQLAQMRGVLAVLGLDRASHAVAHMRDTVEDMLVTEVDPDRAAATFDKLGNNLGALGFLIDMLNYQPALAKKLFVFDDATGELRPLMGRSQAAASPDPAPAPDALVRQALAAAHAPAAPELTERLGAIATSASLAEQPALAAAAAAAAQAVSAEGMDAAAALSQLASVAAPAPAPTDAAPEAPVDEDDLRDIFLDEARDVLATGHTAIAALERDPHDADGLTTLRRTFHTLKGSSRMVGLGEFGQAAWAIEQLMNTWLADQLAASPALLSVTGTALTAFASWVDDIALGLDAAWRADPFRDSADALRLDGRLLPLRTGSVPAPEPEVPVAADDTPALPPGLDFTLDFPDLPLQPLPAAASVEPAADSMADASLALDADDAWSDASPASATPAAPDSKAALTESDLSALFDGIDLALPGPADEVIEIHDIDLASLGALDAAAAAPMAAKAEPAAPNAFGDAPVADAADATSAAAWTTEPAPTTEADVPTAFPIDELQAPVEPLAPAHDLPASHAEDALAEAQALDDEQTKVIDGLRIPIALYNVYLNEADEWSRQLQGNLGEWALEPHRPLPEGAADMAHALAGSSATVGFAALSGLAKKLETGLRHAAVQSHDAGSHAPVFVAAAEEIRRLLHQFAAGFLKEPQADVLQALDALETPVAVPVAAAQAAVFESNPALASVPSASYATNFEAFEVLQPVPDADDELDQTDAVDVDLFPIFEEEAIELLPQLGAALRQWTARPDNTSARTEVLRVLHTLKGSARLAGALRLGELAHLFESDIEALGAEPADAALLTPLLGRLDALQATFDQLRANDAQRYAALASPAEVPDTVFEAPRPAPEPLAPRVPLGVVHALDITTPTGGSAASRQAAAQTVRVRAPLLERLLNQAGEIMLTRSRMESELGQLRGALKDMTGNLERLRQQLRDVELQAETQMASRLAQAKESQQGFDPLEFDRFTRVQELTRMMAESVNDVGTVQRNLQRTVDVSEDELAAQARQTRELQRDLLRTRMLEFEGISERLYRVVRQTSKETGKQVALEIVGGRIEMDRAVLDRMTPAFEHLLRNSVVHGIEAPEARLAAGKPAVGRISVRLRQEGNDVSVEFEDDGRGLDLLAIRNRAASLGLVAPDTVIDDNTAASLIQQPGFSTAAEITELAGRGIGMDVVRAEVNALGGRIETRSTFGQGTRFGLVLPLTTAVTQVVLLRMGGLSVGVPAGVLELVRRTTPAELAQAYASGSIAFGGEDVPFYWAGALLQSSQRSTEGGGRTTPVVLVRSAGQRVALHVDEVLGNQEVVVKNLGPQFARLPGLSGMTVLASGAIVLIYNPLALATVYGEQARRWMASAGALRQPHTGRATPASDVPLVLVVDDSITVRRVTQRLLQREGYRVALASDGLQALKALQDERPVMVLSDIEMPRMDGFDLLRTIRNDASLAGLPVVMITSRIAQKHRDHARALGADHYLGKPYAEDELLALVRQYSSNAAAATET